MTIHSGFARRARADEIDGCPLSAAGHERTCARCPFNALRPGSARVGCALSTPHDAFARALGQLERLDGAAAARLDEILRAERETGDEEGLPPAALGDLAELAARWWPLVGNDLEVQQLVAGVLLFSRAAIASGEPVRILA